MEIFKQEKLSIPIEIMCEEHIAVIGVGAVGSRVGESLALLCCKNITFVDMDIFEPDNFAKTSVLIDILEDIGRNKAIATAQRCQKRMMEGGNAVGIAGDVQELGANFFSEFSVVIVCVDNFKARQHCNVMIRQANPRPVLIFAGTSGNFAEAGLIDGSDFCMRCTWDETWLSNATAKRTSCRIDYLETEKQGIVPTSAFASSMAALLVTQLFLSYVSGDESMRNVRLSYLSRPGTINLSKTYPIKRNCLDCNLTSTENIHNLSGNVMQLSLPELFDQISVQLGTTEYTIIPPCLFVIRDACPVCGKEVIVMKPERRLYQADITCPQCRGLAANNTIGIPSPELLSFKPLEYNLSVSHLSLFDLGFRIGDIITVQEKDIFDGNLYYFSCVEDRKIIEKELILI